MGKHFGRGSAATAAAAVIGLGFTASAPRHAQAAGVTWSFAKVADTTTILPGGGTVSDFNQPTFDGTNLAFTGTLAGGTTRALFMAGPRGIERLATTGTTAVPGSAETFSSFEQPNIDGGRIAFVGAGATREGLYLFEPNYNAPTVVADTTMTAPGSGQLYNQFESRGQPSIDGQNIAFSAGYTNSYGGVYLKTPGAGIQKVIDQQTTIPGRTAKFIFFDRVDTQNGAVVFQGGQGSASTSGVFTNLGGTLRTVADGATTMPDGFTFSLEGSTNRGHTIDNGKIQFYGFSNSNYGVWTEQSPGNFSTVAQVGSAVPGFGSIQAMDNQAYDNGHSIVSARHNLAGYAVYSDINGPLEPVAYPGATIDGKAVTTASLVLNSYRGRSFAFTARFNDGSEAIYLATSSAAAPANAVLKAFTSGGVQDNSPHNGTGDSVNNTRLISRTANGDERRAMAEYNLVDYAGIDLASATLDGVMNTNNSFDTGVRMIGVEIYNADGIIKNADFNLTAALAGQIAHNPAVSSTTPFHIDLTDEIQALLDAGQTKIGVRFTPLNDQSVSVITGSELPTLAIVVPEATCVLGLGLAMLSMPRPRRRRSVCAR